MYSSRIPRLLHPHDGHAIAPGVLTRTLVLDFAAGFSRNLYGSSITRFEILKLLKRGVKRLEELHGFGNPLL